MFRCLFWLFFAPCVCFAQFTPFCDTTKGYTHYRTFFEPYVGEKFEVLYKKMSTFPDLQDKGFLTMICKPCTNFCYDSEHTKVCFTFKGVNVFCIFKEEPTDDTMLPFNAIIQHIFIIVYPIYIDALTGETSFRGCILNLK